MYARSGIEQAPLQTYVAAAIFAPLRSIVRQLFGGITLVDCVKQSPQMQEHWSAMLLALEGHSDWVTAVQFSGNGSMLASASWDMTVIVWDPSIGV
jgi:WD40 repeat protein